MGDPANPSTTSADLNTRAVLARIRALSISDASVIASPAVQEIQAQVDLGRIDAEEGDGLLVTARDQLHAALARGDLPARDIVAISAELRSLHEKLLGVVERRERRLAEALARAKIAKGAEG